MMQRKEFEDLLLELGFVHKNRSFNVFHTQPYYLEAPGLSFKFDEVRHDFSNVYALKYNGEAISILYLDELSDIIYSDTEYSISLVGKHRYVHVPDPASIAKDSLSKEIVEFFKGE